MLALAHASGNRHEIEQAQARFSKRQNRECLTRQRCVIVFFLRRIQFGCFIFYAYRSGEVSCFLQHYRTVQQMVCQATTEGRFLQVRNVKEMSSFIVVRTMCV